MFPCVCSTNLLKLFCPCGLRRSCGYCNRWHKLIVYIMLHLSILYTIFLWGGYTSTSFFQEGDKCYFSDTTVSSISVTSYYYTVTNGGKTFENLNKTGPNLYKYWATTTWCPWGPLRSRKSPHICPSTQLFQATKSTLYPRGR